MPNNTKARSQMIHEAALRLVDTFALDSMPRESDADKEALRLAYRGYAESLMAETGCTYDTARRHVVKANRIKRHPNYDGAGGYVAAGWGGKRGGAGRPKIDTE